MNFWRGGGGFGRNRTPGFWNGDFVHRNCSIRNRNKKFLQGRDSRDLCEYSRWLWWWWFSKCIPSSLSVKQYMLFRRLEPQLEPQQARKDDGLEAAMKSMAESSALLNKTLATGLQFMFSAMKPPGKIGYQSSNPPGFTANNWFNQLQFPPFYSDTHMSATREHTEQHNFDFDGYTHGKYNEWIPQSIKCWSFVVGN